MKPAIVLTLFIALVACGKLEQPVAIIQASTIPECLDKAEKTLGSTIATIEFDDQRRASGALKNGRKFLCKIKKPSFNDIFLHGWYKKAPD